MRSALILAILLATTAVAAADAPSVDAVKAAALEFSDQVHGGKPLDTAGYARFAAPFWYDGNTYTSADDPAIAKACTKQFGAKGTVKTAKKLAAYVNCFTLSMFGGALDGDATWVEVDPKHVPAEFKKHAAKLAKLGKDRRIVMSHFQPAGPAESWSLFVAHTRDGKVVFDAWLLINDVDVP